MGIRKKMRWKFYFAFRCREDQIQRHYDGRNFGENCVVFGSLSTMQRCIINNISNNKH